MKKIFFLLLAQFCFHCLIRAQDTIVKRDGEQVRAKVTEINPTEIRYKRFDNPDGPLFIIPRSDVVLIRYANGTSEVIRTAPPPPVPAAESRYKPAEIEIRGNAYYYHDMRLNPNTLCDIVSGSGNMAATAEIRKARAMSRGGKGLMIPGIPVTSVFGLILLEYTLDHSYSYRTNNEFIVVGAVGTGIGIAAIISGIMLQVNAKDHLRNGVELYNSGLRQK